jgi:hypothetical protein
MRAAQEKQEAAEKAELEFIRSRTICGMYLPRGGETYEFFQRVERLQGCGKHVFDPVTQTLRRPKREM